MHQSQGKEEDTQVVQELKALQSKKVKLVATRSGPSLTRMDSLLVKWDSPFGIAGTRSFLGVVQDNPVSVRVAFVVKTLPRAEKVHW